MVAEARYLRLSPIAMTQLSGPNSGNAQHEAIAMLSRGDLSEAQLRQRLASKGFDTAEITNAVEVLLARGYLDDERIARHLVDRALESGRGANWVRAQLTRRGLNPALIENAEASARDDTQERARGAILGKFGPPHTLENKDRQRAFRFLVGRGFDPECAAEVLGAEPDS